MVYRKRTRKPMKRRRFRTRKMFKKRSSKFDAKCYRKITAECTLEHDTVAGGATASINFGSNATPPNGYVRHTDSTEWTKFSALYREYKVLGIKFRYWPATISGSTNKAIGDGHYMSVPDYLPDESTVTGAYQVNDFYRQFNAGKPFKKYINLKKFWASKARQYIDTSTTYPDAGSVIKVYSTGFSTGDFLGKL